MDDSVGEVTRGARAILVVPEWHGQGLSRDLDARVGEAKGLAVAIGLDVVAVHPLRLRQTRAATLIGVGQIAAIQPDVPASEAQPVLLHAPLPAHQPPHLQPEQPGRTPRRAGVAPYA